MSKVLLDRKYAIYTCEVLRSHIKFSGPFNKKLDMTKKLNSLTAAFSGFSNMSNSFTPLISSSNDSLKI